MIPIPKTQSAFLQSFAIKVFKAILAKANVSSEDYSISTELLAEATNAFLKDIYRLDEQQRGDISTAKFAGYWGFWIRKIKPILIKNKGMPVDINERIALQFALTLVVSVRSSGSFSDQVWTECQADEKISCNGAECFLMYTEKKFNYHNSFYEKDILHSLRKRTFGPHHLSIIIEHLIYSSCLKQQYDEKDRLQLYAKK